MTQAIWNGTVIADSETTSVVEGNHYFPADSVRWDLLEENDRQTVCHWKCTASYYDIGVTVKRTPTERDDQATSEPGRLRGLFSGGRSR